MIEHSSMPDQALFDRLQELQKIDQKWQNEERRTAIGKEISYIVFEQMWRYGQKHQEGIHNE